MNANSEIEYNTKVSKSFTPFCLIIRAYVTGLAFFFFCGAMNAHAYNTAVIFVYKVGYVFLFFRLFLCLYTGLRDTCDDVTRR